MSWRAASARRLRRRRSRRPRTGACRSSPRPPPWPGRGSPPGSRSRRAPTAERWSGRARCRDRAARHRRRLPRPPRASASRTSSSPLSELCNGGVGPAPQDDGFVIRSSFTRHLPVGIFGAVGRRTLGGVMRILVVEDEWRISAFLARALGAEGFAVEVASDGEHGAQRALADDYDLVILDLLLPGRSGLEVLRDLHRERPDLPVVVLSARRDLPTKLRGFELGAVDYVPKPFALDELLARVRVQLRRLDPSEAGSTISVGALRLHLASRQAHIDGRVADLSDREFRVRHFLLAH